MFSRLFCHGDNFTENLSFSWSEDLVLSQIVLTGACRTRQVNRKHDHVLLAGIGSASLHNPYPIGAGFAKTETVIPWLGEKRLRLVFG